MGARDFTDEEVTRFMSFLLDGGADPETSNTFRMIEQLKRERDYWRDVAAYLADCHAATADYDGGLRTTSLSRKRRLASIATTSAEALRGRFHKRHAERTLESVATRCQEAAARLGGSKDER